MVVMGSPIGVWPGKEEGQLCEDAPSSWLAEEILLLPSAQLPAVLPCPALGQGQRRNI